MEKKTLLITVSQACWLQQGSYEVAQTLTANGGYTQIIQILLQHAIFLKNMDRY